MKTFPCLLACSALLAASAIAPAAFAQDPTPASPGPGYGYGSSAPPAGYPAPAYAAPTGDYLPIYGAPAGYYAPDARPWAFHDIRSTERRSPAMMITGFSMVGVGVGAVITGAFIYSASQNIVYGLCVTEEQCNSTPRSAQAGAAGGIAAMVSGGLLIAVGLPLGIVGSARKPRKDQASPVPQVSVGPTGGSLRWTF